MPHPEDDQAVGLPSLHESAWNAVVRELDRLGWEPSEDEDGNFPCHATYMPDAREVIGLYAHSPITSIPSIEECAASFARFREVVGLA